MEKQDKNVLGVDVSSCVPNSPRGRLMYYLDCVNSLVDLGDQYDTSKLRNFEYSHLLTDADTDVLISLCFLYAPDKLDKHVMFQDDDLCGDNLNKFYEVNSLRYKYQINDTVNAGEQGRRVFKVMTYKRKWLLRNWINPMHFFADRLERIASNRRNIRRQTVQFQSSLTYNNESEKSTLLEQKPNKNRCCCIII